MKNFINTAKASLTSLDGTKDQKVFVQHDTASSINPPTPLEVLRYRYHHGVNLGSCFVLEKWLTPSMFCHGAECSELSAVTASVDHIGHTATKQKWEAHWATMLSDADLDWLVNVGHCTTTRLPIGYFTMGPHYTKHTPFAKVGDVYENAWHAVTKIVSRARSRGIGTLIDFHALPGGANGGDHSGTSSGKAELWTDSASQALAAHCLVDLAHHLKTMDGVVGLQLCNEVEYNAPGMYQWYDKVIAAIAAVDRTIPIYISDGWDLSRALRYAQSLNFPHTNPIIVDTHLYWAFSEADKSKSPQQIIAEVPSKLEELDGRDGNVFSHGAAQVVVGEYSCVLTEEGWAKAGKGVDRTQLAAKFGQAQSQRWHQRSGGAFFWTLKMDWMDGGEWGFIQQTKNKAIQAPASAKLFKYEIEWRISHALSQRAGRRQVDVTNHVRYWSVNSPDKHFEHWRFEKGWDVGWSDAMSFFGMRNSGKLGHNIGEGADVIGCLDIWVRKRIVDSGVAGPFVWEFEHGLRQGIRGFQEGAEV